MENNSLFLLSLGEIHKGPVAPSPSHFYEPLVLTTYVRERLLLLYCTPRFEVRGFFEIVWAYVQGYGSGSTWIRSTFFMSLCLILRT